MTINDSTFPDDSDIGNVFRIRCSAAQEIQPLHNISNDDTSALLSIVQILKMIIDLHYLNCMCHMIRTTYNLYNCPIQPESTRCHYDGLAEVLRINQLKYNIIESFDLVKICYDYNINPDCLYDNGFDLRHLVVYLMQSNHIYS